MRMRTLISTLLVALISTVLVTSTLAAPASAAVSMRTWSQLAKCESGGRWHIATGNGYYGGLQISTRHLACLRRQAVRRPATPCDQASADPRCHAHPATVRGGAPGRPARGASAGADAHLRAAAG